MSHQHDPVIFEPAYYDRLRSIERTHWWAVGMQKAMAALLAGSPIPHRILDAGCGTGHLLSLFRERSPGSDLTGVDLSFHAVSYCRGLQIRAAVADASRLPFPDGEFDLLLCIDTLQHVHSLEGGLDLVREIARVLAPGGRVYLRTNSSLGRRRIEADLTAYRRYTTDQVRDLFRGAGLEVERATYLNMIPGLWGALRELFSSPRSHHHAADGTPALSIRLPRSAFLNALLKCVLSAEAWWIGRGHDLPFGHSTAFIATKRGKL